MPHPLSKSIEVADIGCGFGGLLVALGPKLPDTLLLGILIAVMSGTGRPYGLKMNAQG